MNKLIFFLVIPLMLIIISQTSQNVDAQQSTIFRGIDYSDEDLGNGKHLWIGGLPPRLDSGGENYDTPYFKTEMVNSITVETGTGSFSLNKNACALTFYKGEFINGTSIPEISSDSYLMYGAVLGTQNWIELTNINNAVCQTQVIEDGQNIELRGTKEVSDEGKVVFRWIKNMDKPLKIQIEVTNLNPVWTNHKVGIKQTIHVPDTIQFGNTTFFLPDFNGTIVNRDWITSHASEIIGLTEKTYYDIGLGFNNLQNVEILYENLQSKLVFNYFYGENQILPDQTLIIDPTFGYDTGTHVKLKNGGTTCGTDNIIAGANTAIADDPGVTDCGRSTTEWDTTSLPDNLVTIDDVDLRVDTTAGSGPTSSCHYSQIVTQPSTSSDITTWLDIADGPLYLTSDSMCDTVANDYLRDLGTTADADLEALVKAGDNWFAIGIRQSSEGGQQATTQANFELQVQYTLAPEYTITSLDVYESGSRLLDDGNPICTGINLTQADTCLTSLIEKHTYQFQVNVTNTGEDTGTPNLFSFNSTVGLNDIFGSISSTDLLSGCNDNGTDRTWTPAIDNGTNATSTPGTTCAIPNNTVGNWIYYFIVTIERDANNGTGIFYIMDPNNFNFTSTATTFTIIQLPDGVSDLIASNPTFASIDLSWTEPNLYTGNLTGYQINSTTPHGNPSTVLVNNTNSSGTTSTVLDLSFATLYSFRISPWTEIGNNPTGNIANSSTTGETVTIGTVVINQTNPDIIDMRFQRTEVNTTSTRVDVLYSNSYNLTCTVDHRFARTSINYSNLDIVVFDASTSNSSFIFNDHTNDLVNMYCYNENDTTNDGRYQITWTSFPLLDQFANFRSGVYGTQGMFGVIDFITLAVVILSMIGLNRINESVGVIFNIILLGALASFGIIELPTIIFGALTVVLVFTIASTRKK